MGQVLSFPRREPSEPSSIELAEFELCAAMGELSIKFDSAATALDALTLALEEATMVLAPLIAMSIVFDGLGGFTLVPHENG